ncbi:helix-turn-helix domain-containing protein [Streptomyces profundus]|uniref:helix-turn-helix domain-containing protein n=1 Tax=Streptomyces profundus TaxID=2867410 RepID=UPI001D169798|nr:helix-turn-helix transcriptional regulator [Streptomyces sp. MA3_2.13]UED84877.1 helix-turn-helix domain-containing protein [Streptomyces sp. MA3_2.13]
MRTDIESATPALCRIQLANELRRLRVASELKANRVCARLIWSPSKLTRLEGAENTVVEPADVIALCEIYGAGPALKKELVEFARVTKEKKDWWQNPEYHPLITPVFRAFLGLESSTSGLLNYESEFVPGLLQTEAYIRAIYQEAHREMTPDDVERHVAIRLTRQENLLRKPNPLRYTVIINESVLRRKVGSAELMREQLAHIVKTAEGRAHVRVQVVPFGMGVHPGMNGSFVIFQFDEPTVAPSIVYLESLADSWVSRKERYVQRYEDTFRDLQALAPGHQESLGLLKKAIKEF